MSNVSSVKQKIVVVGGGITGLVAAYKIQNESQQKQLDLDITVVESSHRLGGKIHTTKKRWICH